MTANSALVTHDLTVRYGDTTAADRINLAAAPGEILGLLGPNGAGKTSIIRALTTIVPIASGDAEIAGHRIADQQRVRASIGVLPESNGYPGGQTALAYLRYYGQLFGLDRREARARADRLLDQVGLAENHQPIATFSRVSRSWPTMSRPAFCGLGCGT